VIHDFWNKEAYQAIGVKKAKAITAIGMFYDMEDPNQFIRDAAEVLDEDGIFIAQLMTLKPMLKQNDVGNICHEHLEFYTYASLKFLFEQNGLEIFRIDYPEESFEEELYAFRDRLEKHRALCVDYIEKCVAAGKKVYAYGASTKGNVILQYYGLDNTLIAGAADLNPVKWGKYTLTDIPIVSEEEGREKADVFLVLPYAFVDSFIEREQEWLEKGGEFVVPLPEFRVVRKAP